MTLITTLDGSVSADLEALVLRQFDLLKERGLLFYEDPNVEYVTDDGFKVSSPRPWNHVCLISLTVRIS